MKYLASLIVVVTILISSVIPAYAQQPQLATYRESAHILVDDVSQNTTSAFITLSTSSNLEMRVPTDVSNAISDTQNITSVRITNAPNCALGLTLMSATGKVYNEAKFGINPVTQSCVMVTIMDQSLIATHNIKTIQARGQAIGDSLIGKIDKAFGLDANIYAVFVRPVSQHELSATPSPSSGRPSAEASIIAIYIFSASKTNYLLDTLSGILLPRQIKDAGGFYDAANKMSAYNDSSVTFEILPLQNATLYQLQVARSYPITHNVQTIQPLELLGINELDRSSYFNLGFFPLNSLLEVTILSKNNLAIIDHGGNIIPTTISHGQKIPTDLTKPGWIFDPESGKQIFAVYLFGTTTAATDNQLTLTIGNSTAQISQNQNPQGPSPSTTSSNDYSTYVIIGIVAAGAAAVYLFMRRK
jgi:hypothetical protein